MSATPTPSPDALPIPEGAKHTPGPWIDGAGSGNTIAVSAKHWHAPLVCKVYAYKRSADECEANARLIAASPDLLAAAQAFVAPYADLNDDWLREMVSVRPGDLRIVDDRGLTAHGAASILTFRAAIRAAQTGER